MMSARSVRRDWHVHDDDYDDEVHDSVNADTSRLAKIVSEYLGRALASRVQQYRVAVGLASISYDDVSKASELARGCWPG